MKKKPVKYMDHTMMECLSCRTKMISWDRHDFFPCACGKCAIDGGFDYIKISGDKGDFRLHNIRVPEYLKEGK